MHQIIKNGHIYMTSGELELDWILCMKAGIFQKPNPAFVDQGCFVMSVYCTDYTFFIF